MYAAWTVKHKPKSLAEVVGNREAIAALEQWIKSWDRGIPPQRAAFLHGPPGIGKTVAVEAIAHDLGLELIEKNASDYRTEEKIRQFAGLASQYATFFGSKRVILLDEMDGIYGTVDKGAIPAVTAIIGDARCPIILIANDFWDKKFIAFRDKKKYLVLEFKKPPAGEVLRHLTRICTAEGIEADEDALKFVAQRSIGDVRSAVNDLQALAQGRRKLVYDDVSWLAYRDRKDLIFNVLRLVLYGKTCDTAKQAVDLADVDPDMLFEWIYENVPYHFTVPGELAQAMEALALADVYRGRIRRSQDWRLMRYVVDFMTAGVAMARVKSKVSGWVPFRFPQRIMALSRSRAERALQKRVGGKIKRRMHVSVAVAQRDILPYVRVIFENSPQRASGLADWFDFDEEEVGYFGGGRRKKPKVTASTRKKRQTGA